MNFTLYNIRQVMDGTVREYRDGSGRSALIFEHHGRNRGDKIEQRCPHCGKDATPLKVQEARERLRKPNFEIILHYFDAQQKWQNVVLWRKNLPEMLELGERWDQNCKPGWGRTDLRAMERGPHGA